MAIEINLWELLGKNKMNAVDLSKKNGISYQQITNIKRGLTKKIELDTIEKLLLGLNCEPNDLFKIINK